MNYLGHLVVSRDLPPGTRVGNVLGDFYKGPPERIPEPLREGVVLHRKIDIYTDRHPAFLASMARVEPRLSRLAGIMVDMYYDHFLALEWADWTGHPLEEDVHAFYLDLDAFEAYWTPELRSVRPWLVGKDWLCSYRDTAHLDRSFRGLSARLKVPGNRLHEGLAPLLTDYEGFRNDFRDFLPDCLAHFRPGNP